MKGYLIIDHSRDNIDYQMFISKEAAAKKFIEMARRYGEILDDPEILANDQDDMEELAEGGIYSPNSQLVLEIVPCDLMDLEEYDRQLRTNIAFCNVDEKDWPEDIIEHLKDQFTDDDRDCYRENGYTGAMAVVWDPFEYRTNKELVNFIETGDF